MKIYKFKYQNKIGLFRTILPIYEGSSDGSVKVKVKKHAVDLNGGAPPEVQIDAWKCIIPIQSRWKLWAPVQQVKGCASAIRSSARTSLSGWTGTSSLAEHDPPSGELVSSLAWLWLGPRARGAFCKEGFGRGRRDSASGPARGTWGWRGASGLGWMGRREAFRKI
jgi:hypothetical protein